MPAFVTHYADSGFSSHGRARRIRLRDLRSATPGRFGEQSSPPFASGTPVLVGGVFDNAKEPVHQIRPLRMAPPVPAGCRAVCGRPDEAAPGPAIFGLLDEPAERRSGIIR